MKRTDVHLRREPSWTCCVLVTLVVELTVASSQQSVEGGSTSGRSGRVVAARRPMSEDAWRVPESSRTSGQSAGSGNLRDRRSTADACLVYCVASGASDRLERVCRAVTCVRSSAGIEGRLRVVGHSPVVFS